MPGFDGFGRATIQFLEDLGANNSKAWFQDHRSRYEETYLEPAKQFVAALAKPLDGISPDLHAEPRVNGSIFRINRDIRFSKDKTPYKDHLDLWFWHGERKQALSGLFFRLTADRLILGAGAHGFSPEMLARYRTAITDRDASASLQKIINALEKRSYAIGGDHYKNLPRGITAADKTAERFLRFNALWTSLDAVHPDELGSKRLVSYCAKQWRAMSPLHTWLTERVAQPAD